MESWHILVSFFDSLWKHYCVQPGKEHHDKYKQKSGSVIHLQSSLPRKSQLLVNAVAGEAEAGADVCGLLTDRGTVFGMGVLEEVRCVCWRGRF